MVRKSSSFSQGNCPQLTATEKKIVPLISEQYLTVKQIAIRRKTSVRAVQKIVKSLKEKGALNIVRKQVRFFDSTSELSSSKARYRIRLHGQEWHIKILEKDERYKKLLAKCNKITIDKNTVRLHRDTIEVYSGEGLSFIADDVHKATSRSLEYWDRFFTRLEHEFNVILVKNRFQNIMLVNQHYAEMNNELGEEVEKKGVKVKIYANDDGKLWFLIDNSFNLHEAETLHPNTAQGDMETVKAYFNDLRDNPHLRPSELLNLMGDTQKQINVIATGLRSIVELLKPQVQEEQKEEPKGQKRLQDYVG